MTKKYNIAVIGATGNVGRETLQILAERAFPVGRIYAVASKSSLGEEVSFGDSTLKIVSLDDLDFTKIDIAFFAAGSEISKEYVRKATDSGCIVIDKSSFFRQDPKVPLIVPEVNAASLKDYKSCNIIANPNCCTIPIAIALKPLDNAALIKRVVISTYQSTSGAGTKAMNELYNQTKARYTFGEPVSSVFPKPIAFNLIPHIGDFNDEGYSSEESKISNELQKIIGYHIKSTITCVRVPIFITHSMSINVEFANYINALEAKEILREADGIVVVPDKDKYLSPLEIAGEDHVYISRIRDDLSATNSINLWVTADNLRKGAALNGIQIAEELTKNYL
jgi:aspartate-semialdehyde dehydrogenase